MSWWDRFLHWLHSSCQARHLLADYGTDTFTCGVCGRVYTGQELAEWGMKPKAWA